MNKSDQWVRVFDVTEPKRHKNGFTIYKVTSKIFPKTTFEGVIEVVTWKRYSDFKKLHKSLTKLHYSLHLKGAVPSFPEAKLFGRFDEEVIEKRRQAGLDLLQFAAQHPPLFTSSIFVQFFENATSRKLSNAHDEINENLPKPLEPCYCDSNSTMSDTSDSFYSNPETQLSRNGQSNFLPKNQLLQFDPLASSEVNSQSNGISKSENNNWFLFAIQSCDNHENFKIIRSNEENNEQQLSFPKPFSDISDVEVTIQESSLKFAKDKYSDEFLKVEQNANSNYEISISESKFYENKDECQKESSACLSNNNIDSNENKCLSSENIEESNETNCYLVDAATLIGQAQQHEEKQEYEAAFESYKCAVGILIHGLNGEADTEKRAAVRRKTFQYLTRAEFIYDNFLNRENDNRNSNSNKRWAPDSPFKTLTSSLVSSWFGSIDELKTFKVIRVINKVQLVKNISTDNIFIIKVIYKNYQSNSSSPLTQLTHSVNVFPQDIPNMVQIYKIYKTEYAIFLLLQFINGKKLFDQITSFKNSTPPCPDCTFAVTDINEETLPMDNPYRGKLFRWSKTETDEFESEMFDENDYDDRFTKSESFAKQRCLSGSVSSIDSVDNCNYTSKSYLSLCTKYEMTKPKLEVSNLAFCRLDHISDSLESIESICEYDDFDQKHQKTNNQSSLISSTKKQLSTENLNLGISSLLAKAKVMIKNVDETLKRTAVKVTKPEILKRPPLKDVNTEMNFDGKVKKISEVFHHSDSCELNANSNDNRPSICEEKAKFWLSQIVICLKHLHKLGIIYCDLKPDNLLLNENDNLVLTYKCFWNEIPCNLIDESAREHLYVAPELSSNTGKVTDLCDWWSFGVIAYELLTSRPLSSYYPNGITCHTPLYVPDFISIEAKDLISKLLQPNPSERLGRHGPEEIIMHPFFTNIDWGNT